LSPYALHGLLVLSAVFLQLQLFFSGMPCNVD
jgi:hypothetical protein